MSINGDLAREIDVRYFVDVLSKRIDDNSHNPEAVSILKEVGRAALDILPNIPDWAEPYWEKFKP